MVSLQSSIVHFWRKSHFIPCEIGFMTEFWSLEKRILVWNALKPNSPLHVEIVELDVNGRFIILCLKTPGEINLNVVNVYAPTDPREQIDFINSFSKKIISLTNISSLIIAGDWNTTLSSLDKPGGLTWKELIIGIR